MSARSTRQEGPPLIFTGPPDRLLARARLDPALARATLPELQFARAPCRGVGDRLPLQVELTGDGEATLRLQLPPATSTQTLDAVLHVGSVAQRARIEVGPLERLEAEPSSLTLHGETGREASAEVLLRNVGNRPLTLSATVHAVLRPTGVLARGIKSAVSATADDAGSRLERLAEVLKAEGRVDVSLRLRDGTTVIEPGASCRLEIYGTIPPDLPKGARFSGTARLPGLALPIAIQVGPGGADRPRPA